MNEMVSYTSTTWDDIAGCDTSKRVLQEAVVLPTLRPDIFKGLLKPPKGVLLFGPPGTGVSSGHVAKAVDGYC